MTPSRSSAEVREVIRMTSQRLRSGPTSDRRAAEGQWCKAALLVALAQAEGEMTAVELARATGQDRRAVSSRMIALRDQGFANCSLRAGQGRDRYSLTDAGREAVAS